MTKGGLAEGLSQASEINITVTGRKSGKAVTIPIWFVLENGTLYLLPVKGSETQWYKNVMSKPQMRIEAAGAASDVRVTPVTDAKEVSAVVDKFRRKYGPGDVKKYYSKFDVAVVAQVN